MPTFTESTCTRLVFEAWSIAIPMAFEETLVDDGSYWHAWDAHRSISLTSLALTEHGRAVSAREIALHFPPIEGAPVDELPPGLCGRAAIISTENARASQALSGLLAAPGRALIVTITSDDLAWARATWLSIRTYTVPLPSGAERRSARRRKRGG